MSRKEESRLILLKKKKKSKTIQEMPEPRTEKEGSWFRR
jgi:hypothetical protein